MLSSANKNILVRSCRNFSLRKWYFNVELENKFSDSQKVKILQVVNSSDLENLSRYDVAKPRIKKLSEWLKKYGNLNKISELENVDGFTENTVKKFYKSILDGPKNVPNKIKGQILHPVLTDTVRQVSTFGVCDGELRCVGLIDKANYELLDWKYHGIEHPEGKRLQITEILDIAWHITTKLPNADIYVMKAEATSLRAAGSDPNNPKVLTVNLQKAQMIAMVVALINTKNRDVDTSCCRDITDAAKLNQKIYFLRSTLPYRLYGTLVGNERVSTDQTIEILLEKAKEKCANNSHVYVEESLAAMFRSQRELQKDMLGHSLLLALTFMDLCIYMNQKSVAKLSRNGRSGHLDD